MASYAAVLSLMNTLNQINKHPSPPISLDQSQVESLTQNLTFFQVFLERYSIEDDGDLESRITAAAYAAEDIIETHIVDKIDISTVDLCQCLGRVMDLIMKGVMKILGARILDPIHAGLYQGLKRVIEDMGLIKREAMEIMRAQHHLLHANSSRSTASAGPASTWQRSTTPVLDDAMINEVLNKLTGQQNSLQIIPIVGMAGIGKTTFARYIYSNSLIVHHFDILAWATISQEYSVSGILKQVLGQGNEEREMSEIELGERVHKKLWCRRYLIVMDDIWSIEALEKVMCFFPNNNNGSRIMMTTRLSNLKLSGSRVFEVNFLDKIKSWGLFCKIVFGNEISCPVELENIGKEIVKNCRGLPLSIVVIGGLLAKTNKTRAHWEYTLQNLNSLINSEDEEYCLQILYTSYKELPIYLKPCFLYMGIFREDHSIRVTKLIELWVAEGILRPTKDKRLEEVAEECINELIDRNLILIEKLRWNGKAKVCKIHDLLRDLCLREAQKQRFLCVLEQQWNPDMPQCMNMERSICIHYEPEGEYSNALEYASLTRSMFLMCHLGEDVQTLNLKLLRVYSAEYNIHIDSASEGGVLQRANLRLVNIVPRITCIFPLSLSLLWNLQTLKVAIPFHMVPIIAPSAIWEMPLLRHVKINNTLLSDPVCGKNSFVLKDLHTLSGIINLNCCRTVIQSIPNIRILKLYYSGAEYHNFGNNFGHLAKLKSLNLSFSRIGISDVEVFQRYLVQNLSFPHSLKKLTLRGTMLDWEDCMTKIGSLPHLEYLRLNWTACCGAEWETVEGQFCSLKFLQLDCYELRYWRIEDSTHFPRLELLVLRYLEVLEEIPSSIGDIPTLKSIRLFCCSGSAEDSAKRIKEEQLELGNIDLQLHIFATGSQNPIINNVKEIRDIIQYQTENFKWLIGFFNDYKAERIGTDRFICLVNRLFGQKANLILWYITFLDDRYKFTHTDEEEAP